MCPQQRLPVVTPDIANVTLEMMRLVWLVMVYSCIFVTRITT